MKAASISQIKKELLQREPKELLELCLRLAKFKKESKELLTYLLFEADDEAEYINNVKLYVDDAFEEMNTKSYYYLKKSLRKILRNLKRYIRYSKKKETDVELRIYFCRKMKEMRPPISRNRTLQNIFEREMVSIQKVISALHEDLQYDFIEELKDIL